MPYVTNAGIDIYYQLEGDTSNPPLLLLHWFMGSHQTWYDIGWVRLLKPYFYLILVDHRGYGKSSKPHEPEAYQPKNHVDDMLSLLNHLNIEKTHIMGYSMGGRIGFSMLAYTTDRIQSAVLGGMHPYSSKNIPTNLDERIALLKRGMEATLKHYGIGPKAVFDRMVQNDAEALLADTIQTKQWQGLEDKLKGCDIPILLFVGKEDGFYHGMRKVSKILKDVRFIAFPGENHRSAFLKRTLLIPHFERFYHIG